jgi:small-conductance mechanosensitive channel
MSPVAVPKPTIPPIRVPGTDAIASNMVLTFDQAMAWLASHSLQILVAGIGGVLIVVALIALRKIGTRLCRVQGASHWRVTIGRILMRTSTFFIISLAAELVARYAEAPPTVARTVHFFFVIASVLQGAVWVRELVLNLVEHRAGPEADHSTLGSAIGIIRLLVSVALFTVALIVILDNLGVNVTGLVAGLGIGGIAIGLAAQGIFSDLFAALSILFDKPFRRGDSIKWDTTTGNVEAIGLKSTRIRSVTGEEVIISNTNLLSKELHNFARLNRRRIIQKVGVVTQTPPETCERIPQIVREIVNGLGKCSLVRCGLTGFGASSLDFEIQFDVHSEVYDVVFDAQSRFCIALLRRFNQEGIELASPTQVGFTAAPDGRLIMPYPAAVEPAPAEGALAPRQSQG